MDLTAWNKHLPESNEELGGLGCVHAPLGCARVGVDVLEAAAHPRDRLTRHDVVARVLLQPRVGAQDQRTARQHGRRERTAGST